MEFFKRNKKFVWIKPSKSWDVILSECNATYDENFRIIINHERRFLPQKKIDGKWVTICCSNELGWHRWGHDHGFEGLGNAKLTIENAHKWTREAVEYYRKR